ncbi:MAG: ABC transporter ATP-binding protein [Desulfomonilaceae bacterium]
MEQKTTILQIEDLHVSYGGIRAIKGISIDVGPQDIVCLLGSNGAGKSTTVRTISGLETPQSGNIWFEGRSIKGWAPHKIQQLGLVHIPEGRKVFPNLTIRENLLMGAYHTRNKITLKRLFEDVYDTFPILASRVSQLAGTLSGGEQQMLAIGRAMMSRPRLLIMDEPSLGLAPMVVASVFEIIKKIRDEGVTILLIEQNVSVALKIANYAFLLENGVISLEGPAYELMKDERVMRAYLGGDT